MKIIRDFTLRDGYQYMARVPKQYTLIEDNEAPYRFVWMSRESKTFITYCEGDVIIKTCRSLREFEKELESARTFYKRLCID